MGAAEKEARTCTACGKKLRSNNTGEQCSNCKYGRGGAEQNESTPVLLVPRARAAKGIRKRFKVVAEALGVDGDGLIDEFCEAWLERVRHAADPAGGDEPT